jgi:hypothetical protein
VIIERVDRAVFTHQLVNRRRGRPRAVVPTVPTTVRLPQPLFDECCRVALASGQSLPDVVRAAVREFTSSTNHQAVRQW